MGNKYASNVRTYTARNLIWTLSATGAYTPLVMAAPSVFALAAGDYYTTGNLVKQMVQCQWPTEIDWNRESKINIKRFGVFCNFADGLVFEQNNARLALYLSAQAYTISTSGTATGNFTKGQNYLTNLSDPGNFLTAGSIVVGGNLTSTRYPYYVGAKYNTNANIPLSDYYEGSSTISQALSKLVAVGSPKVYVVKVIDNFNFMYESEALLGIVPASASQFVFLTAYLDIAGTNIQLYTKTIDTAFNGLPVSFDVSVEIEVTPQ